MQRKAPRYLHDINDSAGFILQMVQNTTLEDYRAQRMLRSAVERHFEIIGEAMNQLARHDSETASRIDGHEQIIAFRNILIHGYRLIDHAEVWRVIQEDLPPLQEQVQAILNEIDP